MTRLLDTNHGIAFLNGDPRFVTHLAAREEVGDEFAVSTPMLGELYYGAYASQRVADNLAKLATLEARFKVYDFDTACLRRVW